MFRHWLMVRPPAPAPDLPGDPGAGGGGGGGGKPPSGGVSPKPPKVETPKVAAPKVEARAKPAAETPKKPAAAATGGQVHTPPARGIGGRGAAGKSSVVTREVEEAGEESESPAGDDGGEVEEAGEEAPAQAPAKKPGAKLAGLLGDEAPDWLDALADELPEDYDVDPEDLDIRGKRLLAHFRRQSQAGRAELAEQQKAASISTRIAERKALEGSREKADALAAFKAKALDELFVSLAPKGAQPDPSTPEGIEYLVNKRVAEQLKAFRDTILAEDEKRLQTYKTEEAQQSRAEKMEELKAYAAQYPEDFDKKSPIYARIKELVVKSGHALTAQEAHTLAVAEALEREAEPDEREALRSRAKARSKPGGGHGRPAPLRPKGRDGQALSTEEEMEFYEKNPDALKAQLDKHKRRSGLDVIREANRKRATKG